MRKKAKRLAILLSTGLAAVPLMTAQAAVNPNCLQITGTAAASPTTVDLREPITLSYTLYPGGNYTQTVDRSAINLLLVTDESGSMDYRDNGWNSDTRMEILQDASKNLINSLKGLKDKNNKPYRDKVGIVKFDDEATALTFDHDNKSSTPKVSLIDVTDTVGNVTNASRLTAEIDELSSGGNTNIEAALRKADSILKGLPNPYVVLVTDGYATRYGDSGNGTSETTARNLSLTAADILAADGIKTYTVALGKTGGNQVDNELLVSIASKTSAVKYDASNSAELNNVFTQIQKQITIPSSITNITIKQPLPAGFVISDTTDPNVHISGNDLIINVNAVSYPYTVTTVLESSGIKTSQSGTYRLQDATLSYTNACQTVDSTIIGMNVTINVLNTPSVTDMYGNVYEANRYHAVTRYPKVGASVDYDHPQWQLKLPFSGYSITNFNKATLFENDTATHAKVHLEYKAYSNIRSADIDLTPKAPSLTVRDANGNAITSNSSWKKGPATVSVTGSGSRLGEVVLSGTSSNGAAIQIAGTDGTANPDFFANYVDGYQISTSDASSWTTGANLASSGSYTVYARAVTKAITGDPGNLIGGSTSSRAIKLDSDPPPNPTVSVAFMSPIDRDMPDPPVAQLYKYTVTGITDAHSGLSTSTSSRPKLKKGTTTIDSNLQNGDKFLATETDIVNGLYHIVLTDNVGLATDYTVTALPTDTTPPVLPTQDFKPTVHETDKTIEFTITEPQSYVLSTSVNIDGIIHELEPKQPTNYQSVKYSFNLSEVIKDQDKRIGWHKMTINSTNVKGLTDSRDYAFVVNPGPQAKVELVGLRADYYSNSFATAPVALRIVNTSDHRFNDVIVAPKEMEINGVKQIYKGIKVEKLYYGLGNGGSTTAPADGQFKALGALQFTVKSEGDWRVFAKITDDYMPTVPYVTPSADSPRVKIKFDQQRY